MSNQDVSTVKLVDRSGELMSILAGISSKAQSIDEISLETGVPKDTCQRILDDLIEIGLVKERCDSDAYGHLTIRFRRNSRPITAFQER